MSAAPAPARIPTAVQQQQRAPRYPLAAPVDVMVFRATESFCLPGRTVNLGEGGVSLALPEILRQQEIVGLAFELAGVTLQIKARLCHQELLQGGFQFLGLSPEQLVVIQRWTKRASRQSAARRAIRRSKGRGLVGGKRFVVQSRTSLWILLTLFSLIGAGYWWQWLSAWSELESHVVSQATISAWAIPVIPEGSLDGLIIDRVEPLRPKNVWPHHATVVLNIIIGSDGSVLAVEPTAGHDAYTSAAEEAVKWWRFQPVEINGRAVPVSTKVSIRFTSK